MFLMMSEIRDIINKAPEGTQTVLFVFDKYDLSYVPVFIPKDQNVKEACKKHSVGMQKVIAVYDIQKFLETDLAENISKGGTKTAGIS